jgi:REP element-mobilizing transposase RayT
MGTEKSWNKSRVPNFRAQWWDYSHPGEYFITIRTKGQEHYFGQIENGKMELSPIGIIANELWMEIPFHTSNIKLGPYVIMPDHIHGIIQITKGDVVLGKGHAHSLQPQPQPQSQLIQGKNRYQTIGRITISSIIGSFKSAVTKYTHRMGYTFQWQPRFHDRMIRNPQEYHDIAEYIRNNPMKWELNHPSFGK